jgi:hypothetical protein
LGLDVPRWIGILTQRAQRAQRRTVEKRKSRGYGELDD